MYHLGYIKSDHSDTRNQKKQPLETPSSVAVLSRAHGSLSIMNSPSKGLRSGTSGRMTHKRRMVAILLISVALGMCLLTALPALWLVVTGQGHVLNTVEEPERYGSSGEMSDSKSFDGGGGVESYNSMSGSGESLSVSARARGASPPLPCFCILLMLFLFCFFFQKRPSSPPSHAHVCVAELDSFLFASSCVCCRVDWCERGQPRRG